MFFFTSLLVYIYTYQANSVSSVLVIFFLYIFSYCLESYFVPCPRNNIIYYLDGENFNFKL